jgi:hypothetical protein
MCFRFGFLVILILGAGCTKVNKELGEPSTMAPVMTMVRNVTKANPVELSHGGKRTTPTPRSGTEGTGRAQHGVAETRGTGVGANLKSL